MRVLHISIDKAMGGIETFFLNVYRRIDREKIKFDFIEYGYENRDFDQLFTDLGANIYKISDRKKHPIKSYKELENVIKERRYEIVHIHKNSLSDITAIAICQKLEVSTIIIHSHNCNRDNLLIVLLHKFNKAIFNLNNVNKFACSKKAAEWMYKTDEDVMIVNNGIDTERFKYSESVRHKLRKKIGIEDKFIIGAVGRLTEQKNPQYAIEIIRKVKNFSDDFVLMWVGDGPLKEKVEEKVKEYGLNDNVIFTGVVSNPEDYYQVMDIFIMPSLYEGFPIAAIEAQCAGLSVVLSNCITKEAELTENVFWCSLDSVEQWKDILFYISENMSERRSYQDFLKKRGFDINSTVLYLQEFYLTHSKKGL